MAGASSILIAVVAWLLEGFRALDRNESGQDILEYALVGATFAVVIAAILILGFGLLVPDVLDTLCSAVDPLGDGNCLL